MEKVLITGATGLIGSHVAEYFKANGISTICLVRKNSNTDFIKSINSELVYGDITDINLLNSILGSGISYVVHTAALVGDWGNYDDFYNVNVLGTLNVLKAAEYNQVKDVIITGSVSCYGEESATNVKDETCRYNSHYKYFLDSVFPSCMNFYRDTKAEANVKAIEFASEKSMNLTVLNPAWVYGEREFHSGFFDFIKTVKNGPAIVPGSKRNKFHSIYARDLAKIYYLAYNKKLKGINEFLAVSPSAEYQYKLLDLFCLKAGYKIPVRLPKVIIYPPAFIMELVYTLLKTKTVPAISRARVNIFYDNIEYSSKKIMDELGYTPDYALEEGVENTVNWYKSNNYL